MRFSKRERGSTGFIPANMDKVSTFARIESSYIAKARFGSCDSDFQMCRAILRNGAVREVLDFAIFSGGPWTMIWPPASPASGPMSRIQSASAVTVMGSSGDYDGVPFLDEAVEDVDEALDFFEVEADCGLLDEVEVALAEGGVGADRGKGDHSSHSLPSPIFSSIDSRFIKVRCHSAG